MLASALGCLGAVLSMSLPWPQVWRSVAHRRTTGLSASACWLGIALPIGWITYGLLLGDHIQVVTNSVTGGAGVAILTALLIARMDLRTGRGLLVSAAGAGGVVTAAALIAAAAALPQLDGPEAAGLLGAVLAVTSILAAIPQPLSLLRDRTQDLSGLSPLRWRLAAGAGAAWCAYGLLTGQPGVWLSAGASLAGAVIVCVVLVLDGAARPVPALADPAPVVPAPAAAVLAAAVPATDAVTEAVRAGLADADTMAGAPMPGSPMRKPGAARGVARVRPATARPASGARPGPSRGVARVRPPASRGVARVRTAADLVTA